MCLSVYVCVYAIILLCILVCVCVCVVQTWWGGRRGRGKWMLMSLEGGGSMRLARGTRRLMSHSLWGANSGPSHTSGSRYRKVRIRSHSNMSTHSRSGGNRNTSLS